MGLHLVNVPVSICKVASGYFGQLSAALLTPLSEHEAMFSHTSFSQRLVSVL